MESIKMLNGIRVAERDDKLQITNTTATQIFAKLRELTSMENIDIAFCGMSVKLAPRGEDIFPSIKSVDAMIGNLCGVYLLEPDYFSSKILPLILKNFPVYEDLFYIWQSGVSLEIAMGLRSEDD